MNLRIFILAIAITLCLASFIFLTYANERVRWLEIKQRDTDYAQNERIAANELKLARQTLTLNGENQDVNIMLVTPFELQNLNGLEAKE